MWASRTLPGREGCGLVDVVSAMFSYLKVTGFVLYPCKYTGLKGFMYEDMSACVSLHAHVGTCV